jgi:hypothetical protein
MRGAYITSVAGVSVSRKLCSRLKPTNVYISAESTNLVCPRLVVLRRLVASTQ